MSTRRNIRKRPSLIDLMRKQNPSKWEQLLLGQDIFYLRNDLTWTTKSPLNNPRRAPFYAFSTLHKVWVVGGFDFGDGHIADIEVYDLATDTWTVTPDPFSCFGQAFALVRDRYIFAIGGFQSSWTALTNMVERYDSENGTITREADLPIPCFEPGITVGPGDPVTKVDNIYVMGGYLPGGVSGDSIVHLDTLQVYDPRYNNWTVKTPMPVRRGELVLTCGEDGNIYAMGGFNTNEGPFNRVDMYNPRTDTWEPRSPMLVARRRFAAVQTGGKIYAIGGRALADHRELPDVEEFDIYTNTWTLKPPLSIGRYSLAAAIHGSKIYAIGGSTGGIQNVSNVMGLGTVEEGTLP